ncbi:MAG: hypothetical protein WCG63_03180 [Opitutaceae bacterium]|jgi:hypothetical protein
MKLIRTIPILALLASALLISGCATGMSTRKATDLTRFKKIYVESRLADNHRIDAQIAAALKALGRDATYGVATMRPDGIDAIVSYTDRWEWDFKNYMIEIKIDLRDARTDKPLATGSYYQASLKTKASEEVIRLILKPLFST